MMPTTTFDFECDRFVVPPQIGWRWVYTCTVTSVNRLRCTLHACFATFTPLFFAIAAFDHDCKKPRKASQSLFVRLFAGSLVLSILHLSNENIPNYDRKERNIITHSTQRELWDFTEQLEGTTAPSFPY